MPAQNAQVNQAQLNAAARAMIRARSVEMLQPIFNGNFVPTTTPAITVIPRNVGLILGFWIKVVHTVNNGSGVTLNATDFGPANALAQLQFNDLNNVTRVQTAGWHLHFINTVKNRRPFGTALVAATGMDTPIKYGNNFAQQISQSATIAAAGNGTVTMWYYLPLSYSPDDMRGSVYANVTNATMTLILTFPGSSGVTVAAANGTDSTLSMYVGGSAGAVTAATITNTNVVVYQHFYDQLPVGQQGILLPILDLATIYELKYTLQTAIVANQEFPYQYSNFRDILSTMAIYVNTAATGTRGNGSDISYWSLQSANSTNIWKKEPALIACETRNSFQTDFPPGVYYFGSRQRPISTNQYGNMQLVLNPSTAGAGAYQLVGIEDFALVQQLSMAGSLAAS